MNCDHKVSTGDMYSGEHISTAPYDQLVFI